MVKQSDWSKTITSTLRRDELIGRTIRLEQNYHMLHSGGTSHILVKQPDGSKNYHRGTIWWEQDHPIYPLEGRVNYPNPLPRHQNQLYIVLLVLVLRATVRDRSIGAPSIGPLNRLPHYPYRHPWPTRLPPTTRSRPGRARLLPLFPFYVSQY